VAAPYAREITLSTPEGSFEVPGSYTEDYFSWKDCRKGDRG
jgi:hypothetical protein